MAATARDSAVEAPDERTLIITRVFDAPREVVFRAWTDPMLAAGWFGPREHPAAEVEMDARPGGVWRARLRAPDGTGELRLGGVYREVAPPERLALTFAWDQPDGARGHETLITIDLAARGDKTLMTFRQSLFRAAGEARDHDQGWSSALDRLVERLAAREAAP